MCSQLLLEKMSQLEVFFYIPILVAAQYFIALTPSDIGHRVKLRESMSRRLPLHWSVFSKFIRNCLILGRCKKRRPFFKPESFRSGMTRPSLVKFASRWLALNQLRPPATILWWGWSWATATARVRSDSPLHDGLTIKSYSKGQRDVANTAKKIWIGYFTLHFS